MKKKYLVPRVEIVVIDSADLIATSPTLGGDYDPNRPNLAPSWFDDDEDY